MQPPLQEEPGGRVMNSVPRRSLLPPQSVSLAFCFSSRLTRHLQRPDFKSSSTGTVSSIALTAPATISDTSSRCPGYPDGASAPMLSGMHASASRDQSLLRCASAPPPTIRNAAEDTLSLGSSPKANILDTELWRQIRMPVSSRPANSQTAPKDSWMLRIGNRSISPGIARRPFDALQLSHCPR